MRSDSKKWQSFLALPFAAGDEECVEAVEKVNPARTSRIERKYGLSELTFQTQPSAFANKKSPHPLRGEGFFYR
jgi:hypothetical protein